MQGTLLGLYPTCSRPVAFGTRVEIIRLLRSMLVVPFETLNACMQQIRYITKICVMEHLCNTIQDYHPGLRHMLNKSGQQMQHFTNAVATMCDTFRSELNQLHTAHGGSILRTLPPLEKSAHSFFERCTRAYRGIITNQGVVTLSMEYLKRHPLVPAMDFVHAMEGVHVCSTQYIFDMVHRDSKQLPPEWMEPAWHITQCIRVHPLPPCIMEMQRQALVKRYKHDTLCIERCRCIHVCLYCSVKRSNLSQHNLKRRKGLMRYDCVTGGLICVDCNIASILEIDVLGRIAQVGGRTLLLSCCCASPIQYTGTGHEFSTTCGPHCAPPVRTHRTTAAIVVTPIEPQLTCHVCRQRNVVQTLDILCVPQRSMKRVALCARHNLHEGIVRTLGDEEDLDHALAINVRPTGPFRPR